MAAVRVVFFGLFGLSSPPPGPGDDQSGSISGRVTDPQVYGRRRDVAARHTQTNVATAVVTDQDGRFRFPS
jgi:hypothetical protein